jgi:hypothetical protein
VTLLNASAQAGSGSEVRFRSVDGVMAFQSSQPPSRIAKMFSQSIVTHRRIFPESNTVASYCLYFASKIFLQIFSQHAPICFSAPFVICILTHHCRPRVRQTNALGDAAVQTALLRTMAQLAKHSDAVCARLGGSGDGDDPSVIARAMDSLRAHAGAVEGTAHTHVDDNEGAARDAINAVASHQRNIFHSSFHVFTGRANNENQAMCLPYFVRKHVGKLRFSTTLYFDALIILSLTSFLPSHPHTHSHSLRSVAHHTHPVVAAALTLCGELSRLSDGAEAVRAAGLTDIYEWASAEFPRSAAIQVCAHIVQTGFRGMLSVSNSTLQPAMVHGFHSQTNKNESLVEYQRHSPWVF